MFSRIRYRYMKPGEEDRVIRLVAEVFKSSVAPWYSAEGVNEFLRYTRGDDLLKRSRLDHFILVAKDGCDIIGMIEVKKYDHISLFFVAEPFQRTGIGRVLLNRALKICRNRDPWLKRVSVNASPNAIGAYANMGFIPLGPERTINGIRFIPMSIPLERRHLFP